jgi:glycosyltransferase involved in cell wall biosynthesis
MEIVENQIMVSIQCLAYNHEKYIRQCLEGIVSQKTTFKFEAIVHDDASTDNTAKIIHEFEEKYPDIIKPIFEDNNLFQRDIIALRKKMDSAVNGKYISICECDDYWIDENKLQKQVDFLENHKEYSMCFHNALEHYEDNSQEDHLFSHIEDRDYSGLELFETWQVPTASVMVKKDVFDSDIYKMLLYGRDLVFTDIILFLTASKLGKIRGMSDIMSVYRRQSTGVTAKAYFGKESTQIQLANEFLELADIFGKEYRPQAEKNYSQKYFTLFLLSREKGSTNWKYLWNAFFKYPQNLFRFSPHKHMHYIKKLFQIIK